MISSIFLSLVFNQRKQKDISIPMFTAAQLPQPRLGNNLCCFAESFHFCLRFNRFVKKKVSHALYTTSLVARLVKNLPALQESWV